MKLAGIKEGDIVQAQGYICWVREKEGSRLHVRGIHGQWSSVVKATDVQAHWSKRAA